MTDLSNKSHADSQHVIVGKVGSTYGIRGWLKILSFTEVKTTILKFNPWYIEIGQTWQAFQVETSQPHGKGIIAKLAGLHTPEDAKRLSGKNIAILRSQLPVLPKNEFYWDDLKGLTVIDQQGANLGKVIYIMATGANDVLVVKNAKEHAIPYLPGDVIKNIDLDAGVIYVDWEVL